MSQAVDKLKENLSRVSLKSETEISDILSENNLVFGDEYCYFVKSGVVSCFELCATDEYFAVVCDKKLNTANCIFDVENVYSFSEKIKFDENRNLFYGNRLISASDVLSCVDLPSQIGSGCFYRSKQIKKAENFDCVENVNFFGFHGADFLTDISASDKLSNLGNYAFSTCENLSSADLTECGNVFVLPDYCFEKCGNLLSVGFPKNLSAIGKYCFVQCAKLSCVDLSRTKVVDLRDCVFKKCYSLKNVKFPKTLKTIGKKIFKYCSNVEHLDLSNTQLEDFYFSTILGCSSVKKITLPRTIRKIYYDEIDIGGEISVYLTGGVKARDFDFDFQLDLIKYVDSELSMSGENAVVQSDF